MTGILFQAQLNKCKKNLLGVMGVGFCVCVDWGICRQIWVLGSSISEPDTLTNRSGTHLLCVCHMNEFLFHLQLRFSIRKEVSLFFIWQAQLGDVNIYLSTDNFQKN